MQTNTSNTNNFNEYNKMLKKQAKNYQEKLLKNLAYETAKLELNMAYADYYKSKFGNLGSENIIKRRIELSSLNKLFNIK